MRAGVLRNGKIEVRALDEASGPPRIIVVPR
jgi:hypothetical protein